MEDIFSRYEQKYIIEPGNIEAFSDSLCELVRTQHTKNGDLARLNYDNLCSRKYLKRFCDIHEVRNVFGRPG